MKLLPHQVETYKFLKKTKKCLVLSEMGTGKSLPALKLLVEIASLGGKCLYICPAFLVHNVGAEIEKFFKGTKYQILTSPKKDGWGEANIIIMSYNRMKVTPQLFKEVTAVVFDEVHKLCSTESAVTNKAHEYTDNAKNLKYLVGMTGTPLMNRVGELYPLMALCDHTGKFVSIFKSQFNFCMQIQYHRIENKYGRRVHTFEGIKKKKVLLAWLQALSIRHTLAQIGKLPNCEYMEIRVKGSKKSEKILEKAWRRFKEVSQSDAEHFEESYSAKKSFFAYEKTPETIEFVKGLLEETEEHILVLSDHRKAAMKIAEAFNSECILGGLQLEARFKIVDQFQKGELGRILCGTIGALGVGLNLTKASIVVFNDAAWTPAANRQAIGRILRLNQEKDCRVYNIVANEVDSRVTMLNMQKQDLIGETVEKIN